LLPALAWLPALAGLARLATLAGLAGWLPAGCLVSSLRLAAWLAGRVAGWLAWLPGWLVWPGCLACLLAAGLALAGCPGLTG